MSAAAGNGTTGDARVELAMGMLRAAMENVRAAMLILADVRAASQQQKEEGPQLPAMFGRDTRA